MVVAAHQIPVRHPPPIFLLTVPWLRMQHRTGVKQRIDSVQRTLKFDSGVVNVGGSQHSAVRSVYSAEDREGNALLASLVLLTMLFASMLPARFRTIARVRSAPGASIWWESVLPQ